MLLRKGVDIVRYSNESWRASLNSLRNTVPQRRRHLRVRFDDPGDGERFPGADRDFEARQAHSDSGAAALQCGLRSVRHGQHQPADHLPERNPGHRHA